MDVILFNGSVYTVDKDRPHAQAIGIKGNKIALVGSDDEVLAQRTDATKVYDMEGRSVIPGINDGHVHLLNHGIIQDNIILQGCKNREEVIQRSKDYIAERNIPHGDWVVGRGWDQNLFPEKVMLTRHDLDEISTDHPVVLTRVCGCMCVANTAALRAMNVFDETPHIEGGEIELAEDGKPSGRMLGNAEEFTYSHFPKPTKDQLKEYILRSMDLYVKSGITSAQVCDLGLAKVNFKDTIAAYFELDKEGRLPIRANMMLFLHTKEQLEDFLSLGYKTGDGSDFCKIGPFKLQPDNSLGSRTAYLSEPYADDLSTVGVLNNSPEEFYELIELAHTNGLQIVADAIGDGTLDMVLEAYKKLMGNYPKEDPRFCIDHCQITTEAILDKFKEYGVIGGLEIVFLTSDLHIAEERVGKERLKWSYNWKGFFDRGIPVAIGSDSPVEPYNPMYGIYAAVVRKDFSGYPEGGWMPEQRLTLAQAIEGYTTGPAYCTYEEDSKGTITPGKLADITVLSENIFDIEPDALMHVTADMTIVDGKILHAAAPMQD